MKVHVDHGGHLMPAWPTLVDRGDTVEISIVDSPERALRDLRRGVRRLAALALARDLRQLWSRCAGRTEMALDYVALGTADDLRGALGDLAVDRACELEIRSPRTRTEFDEIVERGRRALTPAWEEAAALTAEILARYREVASKLMLDAPPGWEAPVRDMTRQVARLFEVGFLTEAPYAWLEQYPRYLKALDRRLRKLGEGGLGKDAENLARLRPHWERWLGRDAAHHAEGRFDPELMRYRWMIEEYRVSLFAQDLGTSLPVSLPRLERQWSRVRA